MPHKAEIRVHIDTKLKDKAKNLFEHHDLPLDIGVKLLIEYAVQTKKVPYHPHVPNAETIAALEELRNGGGTITTLDELRKILTSRTRKSSKKGIKNAK